MDIFQTFVIVMGVDHWSIDQWCGWNALFLLCLEFIRKLHFPWTPASYCFTSFVPELTILPNSVSWSFLLFNITHRCWDGGICVSSGVSVRKTALRAGKEFAAMLKCIFVWASLMGVDKQHMCVDTFALLQHCSAKVTHFSRFFGVVSFARCFIAV